MEMRKNSRHGDVLIKDTQPPSRRQKSPESVERVQKAIWRQHLKPRELML